MQSNSNKPDGLTIFLDLDGTVIVHNYSPEIDVDQPLDTRLVSLAQFLNSQKFPYQLVLTTSRSHHHAQLVLPILEKYGIRVHSILHSLPTGTRILINDSNDQSSKALAINLERNSDTRISFA